MNPISELSEADRRQALHLMLMHNNIQISNIVMLLQTLNPDALSLMLNQIPIDKRDTSDYKVLHAVSEFYNKVADATNQPEEPENIIVPATFVPNDVSVIR